jgi:hypothetical protein
LVCLVERTIRKQLHIANSFYNFTDIKINYDKYEILTNEKPFINKEITLQISEHIITTIKTASKKQGKRILGVYINAFNNITPTIQKMKQIIYEFRNAIKFKKITHDHVIYLINRVLIPRLEYIGQTHFLDERMADNLFRPIKKLFKNTLQLPNSIHDNIIFNNLFPSINSLFLNQISSHFSFVHNIFNSPQFYTIAIQKILSSQYDFWLPEFPSSCDLIKSITPHNQTYLTKLLIFFNKFNINFHPIVKTQITGGNTPIMSYINNPSKHTIRSLKNKRIIFMDQITTLDGIYLLTYNEVKAINATQYKGSTPNWFKTLEDTAILSDYNRKLLTPLTKPTIQPLTLKH